MREACAGVREEADGAGPEEAGLTAPRSEGAPATDPRAAGEATPGVPTTRIAAGIEYDGAQFRGWQVQPGGRTVQDALEQALAAFTCHPVRVVAAGRTDTGVHALNQVIHFDTTAARSDFSWVRGVNNFLPRGVAVQWAKPVSADFNARFTAFERSYDYVLYVHPVNPTLLAGRVGWVHTPLDVAAMRAAAARLVGRHDFSAFRSSECQAKTPVKTMHEILVAANGPFVHCRFTASAFLHHMVRNLMGCLIAVGRGKQDPAWIDALLAHGDRRRAAATFMPDGLYLSRVGYPPHFEIPAPNLAARPGTWQWPN